jgi:hypothetical protein
MLRKLKLQILAARQLRNTGIVNNWNNEGCEQNGVQKRRRSGRGWNQAVAPTYLGNDGGGGDDDDSGWVIWPV